MNIVFNKCIFAYLRLFYSSISIFMNFKIFLLIFVLSIIMIIMIFLLLFHVIIMKTSAVVVVPRVCHVGLRLDFLKYKIIKIIT